MRASAIIVCPFLNLTLEPRRQQVSCTPTSAASVAEHAAAALSDGAATATAPAHDMRP